MQWFVRGPLMTKLCKVRCNLCRRLSIFPKSRLTVTSSRVSLLIPGCTVPGTSNSQADTALNQAGIFTVTAANDLIGNRIANSFNGMLLDANGQGRGSTYGQVCSNNLEYGRWEGNTFHGHGRFGTYTLGGSEPRRTDQAIATNGFNTDRDGTCAALDPDGSDRGAPVSIVNNVDYDNVFVGHYTAGDIQHRGHRSFSNNNLIYWKETKNFADGCASHISDAYYEDGTMALPDQATFIIQDTVFGDDVQLEANHHCNVGITGFLCQPQYIFDNVRWTQSLDLAATWRYRGRRHLLSRATRCRGHQPCNTGRANGNGRPAVPPRIRINRKWALHVSSFQPKM